MIEKSDCIKIATIAKVHGVSGEIVVRADAGFSAQDIENQFLFVEIDGGLVPFCVEEFREKNHEDALVKFEFVDTKDDAVRLVDSAIYIDRKWLKINDEDEIKEGILIGFSAFDKSIGEIGEIVEIDEQNGMNPLFVVRKNERETLVPITDDFIVEIDQSTRKITFDLPEGLVDLQNTKD